MTTGNPFDDMHRIPSDEHMGMDMGRTITFPSTVPVPIIKKLPPMPAYTASPSVSSAEASPASTAPSTPPPANAPLEWTSADLNYLLSAFYAEQMVAGDIVLEEHLLDPHDLFSPISLQLYMRINSNQDGVPYSAYAATAPIGTGRPFSKLCVAQVTGDTPSAARKALAKAILTEEATLRYITSQYTILADLYSLPLLSLHSVKRGIQGMAGVTEREWMSRLAQLREGKVDAAWSFEAHFEIFLLEGGYCELKKWGGYVDVALGIEKDERGTWAGTYGDVVGFLDVAGAELKV